MIKYHPGTTVLLGAFAAMLSSAACGAGCQGERMAEFDRSLSLAIVVDADVEVVRSIRSVSIYKEDNIHNDFRTLCEFASSVPVAVLAGTVDSERFLSDLHVLPSDAQVDCDKSEDEVFHVLAFEKSGQRYAYFLLRQCDRRRTDGPAMVGLFQPDGGVAVVYSRAASKYLRQWQSEIAGSRIR